MRRTPAPVGKKAPPPKVASKRPKPQGPPYPKVDTTQPPVSTVGAHLRHKGCTWCVVYSGPVLFAHGPHVGIELCVPPSLRGPDGGVDTALVAQIRSAAAARQAIGDALAVSAVLQSAVPSTGAVDGTRYFTPRDRAFCLLVPFAEVAAQWEAEEKGRRARDDVLAHLTERSGASEGDAAPAPMVGSAVSLLSARGGGGTLAVPSPVRHFETEPASEDDPLCGWASDTPRHDSGPSPFASPLLSAPRAGDGRGSPFIDVAAVERSAREALATTEADRGTASPARSAASPTATPVRGAASIRVDKAAVETKDAASLTYGDGYFAWIRAANRGFDAVADAAAALSGAATDLDAQLQRPEEALALALQDAARELQQCVHAVRRHALSAMAAALQERHVGWREQLDALERWGRRAPAPMPALPRPEGDDVSADDIAPATLAPVVPTPSDVVRCLDDLTPGAAVAASLHGGELKRAATLLAAASVTAQSAVDHSPAAAAAGGQLHAALVRAVAPTTAFLASVPECEPAEGAADKRREHNGEALRRLRFEAEAAAQAALEGEHDGDIASYEESALARVERLTEAQELTAALARSLYPPLRAPLVEDRRAAIAGLRTEARTGMARTAAAVVEAKAAAEAAQRRAQRAMEEATSAFARVSYDVGRDLTEQRRAIDAAMEKEAALGAQLLAVSEQLSDALSDRVRLTTLFSAVVVKRSAFLVEYDAAKAAAAKAAWDAFRHRQVVEAYAVSQEALQGWASSALEAADAAAGEAQARLWEKTVALHDEHTALRREVCLATGALHFRKSALRRRIEERLAAAEGEFEAAVETLDPGAKDAAGRRDVLTALSAELQDGVARLEAIEGGSSALFADVSLPLLQDAGRPPPDPTAELRALDEGRQSKIEALDEVLLLRCRDAAPPPPPPPEAEPEAPTPAALEYGTTRDAHSVD